MPVAEYDVEKHHVGLGPTADGIRFGFSISGYSVAGQQYGGSQAYGGPDALISIPTLSRWTQEDFTGGDGQHVWGADPAMFSSCHGMLPTQLGKTIRTSPPLIQLRASSATVGARKPLGAFTFSGYLYTVFTNGVERIDLHTSARTFFALGGDSNVDNVTDWAFDPSYSTLILTFNGATNEAWHLPALTSHAYTGTGLLSNPASGTFTSNIAVIGSKIVQCRSGSLYTWSVTENKDTWAPAAGDWHQPTNPRLPGTWKADVVYNNFLYILCSDPDNGTTLVYYDAGLDSVFTVCKIPYDFVGYSMVEYGGRIYVGGSGRDLTGNDTWAELYEITGTSVRLVRTFSPESKSTAVSRPDAIRAMAVAEGLLFWGNRGKCLGVYDVTTDSFYDGPGLLEPIGVQNFYTLNAARGSVYAYIDNSSDATKAGYYRIALAGDTVTPWTSKFVTSEFAPEIDRHKRWSELRVLSRFGGVAAGYSFTGGAPGGDTFSTLPVKETITNGDNVITVFDLSGAPVSPNIRFQFTHTHTDPGTFCEIVAYTASFTLLDTGKRAWGFTVNATQYVEARDREPLVQNVHDISNELWRYYIERLPLDFVDVDGSEYKVTLTALTQQRPIIGPRVDLQPEGSYESLISVQLIEV